MHNSGQLRNPNSEFWIWLVGDTDPGRAILDLHGEVWNCSPAGGSGFLNSVSRRPEAGSLLRACRDTLAQILRNRYFDIWSKTAASRLCKKLATACVATPPAPAGCTCRCSTDTPECAEAAAEDHFGIQNDGFGSAPRRVTPKTPDPLTPLYI